MAKIIEGNSGGCCGGLGRGDYSETSRNPPGMISKCFKDPSEWSGMPCTNSNSSSCCEGRGECIPTKRGGICEKTLNGGDKEYFKFISGNRYDLTGDELMEEERINLNRRSARRRMRDNRTDNRGYYHPIIYDDSLSDETVLIIILLILFICGAGGLAFIYYKKYKV